MKAKPKDWFKTWASGVPVCQISSYEVAAETFWPALLNKDSDKAACILRSYFIDGFEVPYRIESGSSSLVMVKFYALEMTHLNRPILSHPPLQRSCRLHHHARRSPLVRRKRQRCSRGSSP